METKNVLIGAGAAAGAAAAWFWYKKKQSEGEIPPGTYADQYVPPGVTQDRQSIAYQSTQAEKEKQLDYIKPRMQTFAEQQSQQPESDTVREEDKQEYTTIKGRMLDFQKDQAANGEDTYLDPEKDSKELSSSEPALPENAIVAAVGALAAISDKGKRTTAAKAFVTKFKTYPYPERRAATLYAQKWFQGLSFDQKKKVYELLVSIGLGPAMLALWKKAQEAQNASAPRATDSAATTRAILVKAPPKTLPRNALVVAVVRLAKIEDLSQRKLQAQQFAASMSEYSAESKQEAMRYANTWFRNLPFADKKRVVDVMISIGMGENVRVAWQAAQKAQQDATDAAKATLQSRAVTDQLVKRTADELAAQKAEEERKRVALERTEQAKVTQEVQEDQARTVSRATDYSPTTASSTLTATQKRTLEMQALQSLMNITMKFPSMTQAQQSMVTRTMPMQLAKLPRDSQANVKKLYFAWFARRPKEFQDKVRGILANLR